MKYLINALAALALFLVTGCTIESPVAANDPSSEPPDNDEIFMQVMEDLGMPDWFVSQPEEAIQRAHDLCDVMDELDINSTYDFRRFELNLWQAYIDHDVDLTPEQMGTFMGGSVAAYCPEYNRFME